MSSSIKAGLAAQPPPTRELWDSRGRRLSFSEYPAESPWMHLLISHGFGEHRGWYDHVAGAFRDAGISTYTFDHFHHGTSSGKLGDVADYGEFIRGLRLALDAGVAPRCPPGEPLVLLGHSNGGLAVLLTLPELPPGRVAGVVLTNPLLGLSRRLVRWGLFFARLLTPFAPGLMIPSRSRPERLTSDRSLWGDYGRDPLRLRRLSIRFFREMAVAARRARRQPSCHGKPLLLLCGEQDRVVRKKATMGWYARLEAPAKKLLEYPGLRHELFNETQWRRVLDDIVEWLRSLPPQGRELPEPTQS
ncbi:MAG: alpha/beta fold hydrolase [bacterium]